MEPSKNDRASTDFVNEVLSELIHNWLDEAADEVRHIRAEQAQEPGDDAVDTANRADEILAAQAPKEEVPETSVPGEDGEPVTAQMIRERLAEVMRRQMEFDEEKKAFEIEREKFARERKALDYALRDYEIKYENFEREKDFYAKRMEQQQKLFETKWKILEDELQKLAKEREEFELHKEFRNKVNEFEKQQTVSADYEMFFSGIDNELALRKRYKDLIKIFHPDNLCGDVDTVQEINREYDQLKRRYGY